MQHHLEVGQAEEAKKNRPIEPHPTDEGRCYGVMVSFLIRQAWAGVTVLSFMSTFSTALVPHTFSPSAGLIRVPFIL
jgi:hypothetical protein